MRCRNRHRRLPPACPRNSGPVLSTVFICPACWTRNRSFIWIAMSAAHWTSGNCGRRRLRSRAAVVLRAQSDGRRRGRAIVKKGLDPAHYFNSGVLVFHPHRLRALFPDLMAAVLRLLPELSRPPALSGSGRSEPALPPSAVALAGGTLQLSCTWPDAGCCRRTSLKAACSTSVAANRGASRSALRLSAIWRITVSWSNVALKNEIIHPGKSLIFTGQLHGGAGNAPAAQPHQLT